MSKFDRKDVRIDTYTNASQYADMTLVHLPTGIIVKKHGVIRNAMQREGMEELRKLVEKEI